MDMATLAKAKAIAQELVDEVSEGSVKEVKEQVEDLNKALDALGEDAEAINLDGDTATALLLIAFRQHCWEEGMVCEAGNVTLTNTLGFPFNNSKKSIALANRQPNTNYAVVAWTESTAGNVGEIQVTEKQVNGFKISYSGSVSSVVVQYIVIGGIIK